MAAVGAYRLPGRSLAQGASGLGGARGERQGGGGGGPGAGDGRKAVDGEQGQGRRARAVGRARRTAGTGMESEDGDGEGDEDAGAGTRALEGSWQWCAAREVLVAVYSTCVSQQRSVLGKGRGRRAVHPRVLAAVCYRVLAPLLSAQGLGSGASCR